MRCVYQNTYSFVCIYGVRNFVKLDLVEECLLLDSRLCRIARSRYFLREQRCSREMMQRSTPSAKDMLSPQTKARLKASSNPVSSVSAYSFSSPKSVSVTSPKSLFTAERSHSALNSSSMSTPSDFSHRRFNCQTDCSQSSSVCLNQAESGQSSPSSAIRYYKKQVDEFRSVSLQYRTIIDVLTAKVKTLEAERRRVMRQKIVEADGAVVQLQSEAEERDAVRRGVVILNRAEVIPFERGAPSLCEPSRDGGPRPEESRALWPEPTGCVPELEYAQYSLLRRLDVKWATLINSTAEIFASALLEKCSTVVNEFGVEWSSSAAQSVQLHQQTLDEQLAFVERECDNIAEEIRLAIARAAP